ESPPLELHRPRAALRGLPAIPALQSAFGPKSLRGSKTAQTSKPDRDVRPLRAPPALCKVFRRPIANASTAASHAHEQAPVPCALAHTRPLPCTLDSFQSGPSRQLPQYAIPEILTPASKCFHQPFVLLSARKSRSHCPRLNTKSAASSRTPC